MVHMGRIEALEEYAKINDIPIIEKDGIKFLENLILENNVQNILEIGSAIGYSAIKMALLNEQINVTTIEKDIERYKIAVGNIKKFELEKRIDILNIDAFDFNTSKKFDLIFIDGAKSQYTKWFKLYSDFLNDNGMIICDNLYFHGHVANYDNIKSRNLKQLVRKIREFILFLKENDDFKTNFYDVGDGISVSKRVK